MKNRQTFQHVSMLWARIKLESYMYISMLPVLSIYLLRPIKVVIHNVMCHVTNYIYSPGGNVFVAIYGFIKKAGVD